MSKYFLILSALFIIGVGMYDLVHLGQSMEKVRYLDVLMECQKSITLGQIEDYEKLTYRCLMRDYR